MDNSLKNFTDSIEKYQTSLSNYITCLTKVQACPDLSSHMELLITFLNKTTEFIMCSSTTEQILQKACNSKVFNTTDIMKTLNKVLELQVTLHHIVSSTSTPYLKFNFLSTENYTEACNNIVGNSKKLCDLIEKNDGWISRKLSQIVDMGLRTISSVLQK